MLASMRTTASSIFMKALMFLLVIAFAVWGVGDIVRSGNSGSIAKVGDETISQAEFARASTSFDRTMQALGMQNIDRAMVQQQALRALIEQKIIDQRLRDAGYAVSDAQLASKLRSMREFHDVRGKFDPKIFRATLAQRQMSERQFLDEMRANARTSFFAASLNAEALEVPAAMAALYAASAQETRSAVLVTIAANTVEVPTPDADALRDYYESNKDRFMAPETRTLDYVTFTAADVQKRVDAELTDAAIRARYESDGSDKPYEESKEELRETMRAELMDNAVNDITTQVEDALAAGDDMEKAVQTAGLPATMHRLNKVTATPDTASPLDEAVVAQGFALEQGETSTVQTSADGTYFIVTAHEVNPALPKPYDAVAAEVTHAVATRAKADAVRNRAQQVKNWLAKDDWQEALRAEGIASRTVATVRRPETGETAGVPTLMAEAIFEHKVGEVAGPLTQPNADTMLARIVDHTPGRDTATLGAKTRDALNKEWQAEASQGVFRDLSLRYPVRLNDALLQQMQGDGA